MKQTINLIRTTSDLWGHWDSFEINYHYIGAPLEFKSAMVSLFINFFESKLPLCNNKNDYINKIETKIIKYVLLNWYKTICIIKYINNKLSTFSPLLLKQWINNPETFAIKWKYHISYLRDDNIKSNYFKYLIRYLLTGNNIYISEGERLNLWVKSSDYKQLNMFNK